MTATSTCHDTPRFAPFRDVEIGRLRDAAEERLSVADGDDVAWWSCCVEQCDAMLAGEIDEDRIFAIAGEYGVRVSEGAP